MSAAVSERRITGLEPHLSLDERAAVRAYLQRSEVRLSTMHRVASALLSGAGIMVLLPAVERDSVTTVLRALMSDGLEPINLVLVIGVTASLALPFTALWMVLRDLTQFYFHANHVLGDRRTTCSSLASRSPA